MRNRLIVAAFLLFLGSTVWSLLTGGTGGRMPVNRGSDDRVVTLKVWAGNAAPIDRWRTDAAVEAAKTLNQELAAENRDLVVQVEGTNDPAAWGNYKKKFLMAADSHLAPDIICTGHEDIAAWVAAGLIVPIADSIEAVRAQSAAFADVQPELWRALQYRGKVWGVPQDTEARVLFFSKPLLREMGFDDARMAGLVRDINSGAFTLDDMLALARSAVDAGVVPAGRGYWPRPTRGGDHLQKYRAFGGSIMEESSGRLVADRAALARWFTFQRRIVTSGVTPKNYPGTEWGIWHNTVTRNQVLFWEGGIWNWSRWADQYVSELGGRGYLETNVGYAWPPAANKGEIPASLSHPLVYLITTPAASGQQQQELALRLLAHMTTPELNTRHAVESSHLAILKSQLSYPPYREDRFLYAISRMAGSTGAFFQPNHVRFSQWFDVVMGAMEDAQSGRRSPEQAAEDAVALMRMEIDEEHLAVL